MAPPDSARTPSVPSWEAIDSSDSSALAEVHQGGKGNGNFNDVYAEKEIPPLAASWREEPLMPDEKHKIQQILKACRDHNLSEIRSLAKSNSGLIEDQVRRTAWPILLGSDHNQGDASPDWTALTQHRDENQVLLDVNRSFVYYPEDETERIKDGRKLELSNVITAVLRQHPRLHYFQGYHDIVQVLLLVLGAHAATAAVARLSLLRIRDFMLPTMSGTESHLRLLPAVLYAADTKLYAHLSQTQPFFALAATLTLYAHDIEEYGNIARLFDYFLASEASVPVYFFAVVVMSRKDELLEIEADEPEMLHSILSKLPKPLDLEGLIQRTSGLIAEHPPERLPGRAWSRISSSSVLKTTRDPRQLEKQTLRDGERMFEKHAAEIGRSDAWKQLSQAARRLAFRYRRPALYTGAAILIAVLAVTLRNNDTAIRLMPILIGLRYRVLNSLQRLVP